LKIGINNIVSDLGTLKKENTKKSIYGFTYKELLAQMKALGFAAYRAKQVFDGIYKSRVSSFSEITTLDKETKILLDNNFIFTDFELSKKQTSKDGSIKYLFKLKDEKLIEAVYMPWLDDDNSLERATLCISSQVGCAVDCSFCATGKLGFKRNLDTSEIISQIIFIEKDLNSKINNIVFMGMGEPLLNYKNVVNSIDIMTDPNSALINRRKITLSTSGIVPKIYQLSSIERPVKLAISLHATTNGIRDKIVPINKKGNIEAIMDAVEDYYRNTKMAITYEYIPFLDLNDTELDAKRLAKLTKRVPSRVNLIPFNDISFTNPTGIAKDLKPTPLEKVHKFAEQIRHYGGFAVVRDTFGDDIDAACGQLALSEKQNNNTN
jgi:23S rRNA (adenine2503-C2)-methyltransferase